MEREDSYMIYKKCVLHVYVDHKMGKLVDSLYKIADRMESSTSMSDYQRMISMEELVHLFRRIHRERKIDNIDDILSFIFNFMYVDSISLRRILYTIFFPEEADNDDFVSTFINFKKDRILFPDAEIKCDYLFVSIVKEIETIEDKYKEMIDKRFENREDEYSNNDAEDYLLFYSLTKYIGIYIYRNNIDKSMVEPIYNYLLENFDSISSYYFFNKFERDAIANKKFKYYVATNMVNDFINDKTNKQIS